MTNQPTTIQDDTATQEGIPSVVATPDRWEVARDMMTGMAQPVVRQKLPDGAELSIWNSPYAGGGVNIHPEVVLLLSDGETLRGDEYESISRIEAVFPGHRWPHGRWTDTEVIKQLLDYEAESTRYYYSAEESSPVTVVVVERYHFHDQPSDVLLVVDENGKFLEEILVKKMLGWNSWKLYGWEIRGAGYKNYRFDFAHPSSVI